MKEGEEHFCYAVNKVGTFTTTFSTVFFLPLLILSYIPSRTRVGKNPKPILALVLQDIVEKLYVYSLQ
jgi:hypothetical protein